MFLFGVLPNVVAEILTLDSVTTSCYIAAAYELLLNSCIVKDRIPATCHV